MRLSPHHYLCLNCGRGVAAFWAGARVSGGPQSKPCRFSFTLAQTRTTRAKRAEVRASLFRTPYRRWTATTRRPVKCRRGHRGVPTPRARAEDHDIEDGSRARLRATEPVARCRLRWPSQAAVGCSSAVRSIATEAGQVSAQAHTAGCLLHDCEQRHDRVHLGGHSRERDWRHSSSFGLHR